VKQTLQEKKLKLKGADNKRQNGEECKGTGRTGKKELGKEQMNKDDKIVKRPTPKPGSECGRKTSVASESDDTACLYCELLYSESTVAWFRCKTCCKWACEPCAHMGKKKKNSICL